MGAASWARGGELQVSPAEVLDLLARLRLGFEVEDRCSALAEHVPLLEAVESASSQLLDAVALDDLRPSTIVCIGRTKAGKSTLRYVLTGEGREGIGRGGQRTTQDVITYEWNGIHVVDTPGVGAYGGSLDDAAAKAAVSGADLVLWVATPDSQQLATVTPVLEALDPPRPLVILVNHKRKFSREEVVAGVDADLVFYDRGGFASRFGRILTDTDSGTPTILHVNLGLAMIARDLTDERVASQAGMPPVAAELRRQVESARGQRASIRTRVVAARASGVAEAIAALEAALERTESDLNEGLRCLQRQVEQERATTRSELDDAVTVTLDALEQDMRDALKRAQAHENRGEAQASLNAELVAARTKAQEAIQRVWSRRVTAAAEALGSIIGDVPLDWDAAELVEPPHLELHGDPLNARAAGVAHTVVRVAVTGAMLATPIGWVGKLVGGAAVDKALSAARNGLLPTVAEEQQKRDASVEAARRKCRAWVASAREALPTQLFQAWLDDVTSSCSPYREACCADVRHVGEMRSILRDLRACLRFVSDGEACDVSA